VGAHNFRYLCAELFSKDNSIDDYRRYYVHVRKEDKQLKLTIEESEDILTTEVLVNTGGQQVKKISLASMDGKTIQQEGKLKSCDYKPFHAAPDCFSINDPGEYIATVLYASGKEGCHHFKGQKLQQIPHHWCIGRLTANRFSKQ